VEEVDRYITIVTVTRDNLPGLRRTFESLRLQDFRDAQHVVIDGASVDGSAKWLQTARVFSDTIAVSEPDNGIYDAMNKGAALASGTLVTFLNAGDAYADTQVLSRVAASHRRDRWQWGFGLARPVNPSGRGVRPVHRIAYRRREHAFGRISVPHQAVFMTSSLFRALEGFDPEYTLAADTHLLLRAAEAYRPQTWDTVDVLYLVGGRSDRLVYRLILEKHRIRRALGLALRPGMLDLIWTAASIGVVAIRRGGKRLLNVLSAGQFTRWWSSRGL